MGADKMLTNSVLQWRTRTFLFCHTSVDGQPLSPLGSCIHLGGKLFATCDHLLKNSGKHFVVANETSYQDWTPVGRMATTLAIAEATIVARWPEHDVAYIRVSTNLMANAPVGFNYDPRIAMGMCVGFTGYPFAANGRLNLSASSGIVASLVTVDRFGIQVRTIQIDGMSNEGNSGGPLFAGSTGHLMGMMARRYDPLGHLDRAVTFGDISLLRDRTNIAFAISVDHLVELMPSAFHSEIQATDASSQLSLSPVISAFSPERVDRGM